jgi:hypothetical protein
MIHDAERILTAPAPAKDATSCHFAGIGTSCASQLSLTFCFERTQGENRLPDSAMGKLYVRHTGAGVYPVGMEPRDEFFERLKDRPGGK